MRPATGAANARELVFDGLESGYEVGTAGTKDVGRSKTLQLFHGSEVAFWPNASTHFAGVVQAVPDLPDTEIILESTANGVGGEFHARWQQAEAGIGDYAAIFLPWFWHAEYRRDVPDGFALDEEEAAYAALHGLDLGQMVWRRAKIAELKDPLLFRQEYPATAAEAFQSSGHDSYIKPDAVLRARKLACEGVGALVIGVDPARFGDDRFAMAWRRGRKVEKIESRAKIDTVAGANWCRQVIDRDQPARMFIDAGGTGGGVYDLLVDWGYGEAHGGPVRAVNFGGEPIAADALRLRRQAAPRPAQPPRRDVDALARLAQRSRPAPTFPTSTACRPTPAGRATTTTRTSGCGWRARSACARVVFARPTSGTRWRSPSPSRSRRRRSSFPSCRASPAASPAGSDASARSGRVALRPLQSDNLSWYAVVIRGANMKRREFLRLGVAAAVWPLAANSQEHIRRIGVLMHTTADNPNSQVRIAALQAGLSEAGWSVGRNLRIDVSWSGGDVTRLRKGAADLVALGVDVLVAGVGPTTQTLLQVTRSVPIVMAQSVDPVGAGFVASLARPKGNTTGFMQFEYGLTGKWLELLREMAPGVTRAAVIRDYEVGAGSVVGIAQWAVIQAFASPARVELTPINFRSATDAELDIAAFAQEPNGGFIVVVGSAVTIHHKLIVSLAAKHRMPTVYPYRFYVEAGGLASYGPNLPDLYRRSAGYIDRILKGEKPADLPVQAPTKYELVVNLKTAKTLGLAVSPSLLARADEVIE